MAHTFYGDSAECSKYLAEARGMLALLKNGTTKSATRTRDGVTIKVTQNPNHIYITTGGLFIGYYTNTGLLNVIRDSSFPLPPSETKKNYDVLGYGTDDNRVHKSWTDSKFTQAISWNQPDINGEFTYKGIFYNMPNTPINGGSVINKNQFWIVQHPRHIKYASNLYKLYLVKTDSKEVISKKLVLNLEDESEFIDGETDPDDYYYMTFIDSIMIDSDNVNMYIINISGIIDNYSIYGFPLNDRNTKTKIRKFTLPALDTETVSTSVEFLCEIPLIELLDPYIINDVLYAYAKKLTLGTDPEPNPGNIVNLVSFKYNFIDAPEIGSSIMTIKTGWTGERYVLYSNFYYNIIIYIVYPYGLFLSIDGEVIDLKPYGLIKEGQTPNFSNDGAYQCRYAQLKSHLVVCIQSYVETGYNGTFPGTDPGYPIETLTLSFLTDLSRKAKLLDILNYDIRLDKSGIMSEVFSVTI